MLLYACSERVLNTSEIDIDRITVIFPQERLPFVDVKGGQTSSYEPVQRGVYSYAAIKLDMRGQTLDYPVIDWMGEQPLGPGRFTIKVTINPDAPSRWEQVQTAIVRD